MCAARTKSASIGNTTATQIFGNEDVVGQVLRVKNVPFLITGVLTPKGLSSQGTDQDDIVIMPYTSAMKRVSAAGPPCATSTRRSRARATSTPAQQQIIALLRQRHNIRDGRDDDFTVRNQEEIAAAATATTRNDDGIARPASPAFRSSSAASGS